MPSLKDKKRMVNFIVGRLEDSGLYIVKEISPNHILVAEKPDLKEHPATVYIAAHNSGSGEYRRTVKETELLFYQNAAQGIATAHVFYKDGKTFMVRLGARGNFKGDERSLKNYTKGDIDSMIHLRGLEKLVLGTCGNPLVCYQPETDRIPECIRAYKMCGVILDYSHLQPGDPGYGFAQDRVSRDYKIAKEIGKIVNLPAILELDGKTAKIRTKVQS